MKKIKKESQVQEASQAWFSNWPRALGSDGSRVKFPLGILGSPKKLPHVFGRLELFGFSGCANLVDAYACSEDKNTFSLYALSGKKVICLKSDAKTLAEKRKAVARIVKALAKERAKEILLVLEDKSWLPALDAGLDALYEYDSLKQRDLAKDPPKPKTLFVQVYGVPEYDFTKLNHVMHSVFFVRDLVKRPPEEKPPRALANRLQWPFSFFEKVKFKLLSDGDPEFEKMGLIKAVGSGDRDFSHRPCVLVAQYFHQKAKNKKPIALIGKGVCFDTGGYQVKDGHGMNEMEKDMAGAALVFGVLRAVAALDLPINLVVVAPFVYNHISGTSYMPGGVYTSYNGKTVEIGHTDAEGRLILADALSYVAKNYKPELMIDAATLTGACCVALGQEVAGIFIDPEKLYSDKILKLFLEAGKKTGEKYWPLPLQDSYSEQIQSKIANIKNIGGRWGGAITAALFLKQFTDNIPWWHLDIAGPGIESPGFGVKSLLEVLKKLS